MGKKELAILIDSYSDAKVSGNKYLTQMMITQLEQALNQIFGKDSESVQSEGMTEPQNSDVINEY